MLLSATLSVSWLIAFVLTGKRYLNMNKHTGLKLIIILVLTFLHLHIFANRPGWNGVVNTLITDIIILRSFYIIFIFLINSKIKYKYFKKSIINIAVFVSLTHFMLKFLL